jgi:hypothetical protein
MPPPPPGYRSKVKSRHFAHLWETPGRGIGKINCFDFPRKDDNKDCIVLKNLVIVANKLSTLSTAILA